MSILQKIIFSIIAVFLIHVYCAQVAAGVITSPLASQWIWIGDNILFTILLCTGIISAFVMIICLDFDDSTIRDFFNELYKLYPNSNRMWTWTPWLFVVIAIGLIQYELYLELLLIVGNAVGAFGIMARYKSTCRNVKRVELKEEIENAKEAHRKQKEEHQ